jgi:arabinofuranan 3-O-arabinosyltransferase
VAASIAIAAATFLQAPGRIAADTKLDLVVDPARLVGRATHLWQPDSLGTLPNQIVGYLFPMGPFFVVGHLARVPMWLVQRAWIAALLVLAFWGAARVAERLGFNGSSTRVLAGAAYALSPAMLTLVGSTSGGQIPTALLPWVLVPLMGGSADGSPRRAAARSAGAVIAMGAVNATSTLAALPLAGLWLLTRQRGPRRRQLTAWWVCLVVAGTLWWTVALAVQARYGFDFVPFTETATVTTATTSAVEVLRGTGHWLSLLVTNGPWLPAGWELATGVGAIAGSVAVAAAGIYGLARRDMPERTFLIAGVGLGAAVIAMGYAGPLGSPLAPAARSLLDGQLSPFRNLYKFEPMLRLPLALGFAHGVRTLGSANRRSAPRDLVAVAAAAILLTALPLAHGRLLDQGAFKAIPGYWKQAASWLDERGGRSLLVPASEFGEYGWGRPLDEPLQALGAGPAAVRNLVPLGSAGGTRVLDAISQRLETGRTDGLAEAMNRAGLRYLVVRTDLDPLRSTAPRGPLMQTILDATPGLRRAAAFGPPSPSPSTSDRFRPAVGHREPIRAVEVYEVVDAGPRVRALPADDLLVVTGGPESAVDVDDLGDRPAILAGDAVVPTRAPVLLTDGLRLRDVDFGRVRNAFSYVLTPKEQAPDTGKKPVDRTALAGQDHVASIAMNGVAKLTASSYGPAFSRTPESQPFAAFDGSTASGWAPDASRAGLGQWVQVTLDRSLPMPYVDVRPLRTPDWRQRVTEVVVATDRGTRRTRLRASGVTRVRLPAGDSRRMRVTIARVEGGRGLGPGLAEVTMPGVRVTRPLRLASDQAARLRAGAPLAGLRLMRSASDPFDATRLDEEVRIDREVDLPVGATLEVRGSAIARPGAELDALVSTLGSSELHVSASSTWGGQPVYRGAAASDGDAATAWIAAPGDPAPELDLTWVGARTIDGIAVRAAPGPVAPPRRVRLEAGEERRDVLIDGARRTQFRPLTTDHLRVTVLETAAPPARSGGLVTPIAAGIGELELNGLDLRTVAIGADTTVHVPCGDGPEVLVDGTAHATEVVGTAGDLLAGRGLFVSGCTGPVTVAPGRHSVQSTTIGSIELDTIDLMSPNASTPRPLRPTSIITWSDEHRRIRLGAGAAAYVTTNENANDGWRAELEGRRLEPTRLDGWRQAWLVPRGAGGTLDLTYAPARTYRSGLLLGAAGALAVLALSLIRPRRPHQLAPSPARQVPPVVIGAIGSLAVFLVAGLLALAVPVLILAAGAIRRPQVIPVIAGGLYGAAGVFVVLEPGRFPADTAGAYGAPAQALAAIALAALVASLATSDRR